MMREHLEESPNSLAFVGMGLGKTAAVLDTLDELFRRADAFGALVVAPLRVANLTWPSEVKGWEKFRWMRIANLRTQSGQRDFLNGKAHIYTINWEGIASLVALVERRGKLGLPYDVVIFDELTKAKNHSAKRVNLYRRKVPRVARQWGLTGTPMPNSWKDLFAQVRLIDDGERLGRNFKEFSDEYLVQVGKPEHKVFEDAEGAAECLEKKIADITLTLKSSEWLDIPDTVYEDIEIEFPPELQKRYQRLEQQLVIELRQDKNLNVANAAALVTKLLQFTSGHMYDEEKEVHPIHNLKFDALAKLAKQEKNPLFVACIFKHEQTRIRSQFPDAKFFGDAKTIAAQEEMLREWNAGKIKMLVSHPASVGHGLNFQHGSNLIVWFTLTYNREWYDQMIARLARRGQKEVTKVYRLMIPGTVDDAVAEALANKAENEARLISALQMLESYRKK